jgi:hypothetical protein
VRSNPACSLAGDVSCRSDCRIGQLLVAWIGRPPLARTVPTIAAWSVGLNTSDHVLRGGLCEYQPVASLLKVHTSPGGASERKSSRPEACFKCARISRRPGLGWGCTGPPKVTFPSVRIYDFSNRERQAAALSTMNAAEIRRRSRSVPTMVNAPKIAGSRLHATCIAANDHAHSYSRF